MVKVRVTGGVTLLAGLFVAVSAVLAPAAGSTTVLFAGGATFGTLQPVPPDFGETFLGGAYEGADFPFVDYPASVWPFTGLFDPTLGKSIDIGTENMLALVRSTPGPLVISGVSEGAMVAQRVQAILNDDPGLPSSTTFIVIADPDLGALSGFQGIHLPIFDYTPQPLAETRFNTMVVINQYDLVGDPIARPWNLLTDLNALMAFFYVHPYAQDADLSTVPAQNITTTTNGQGGTTTTYLVPTEQLPLTMPLRQLGVPSGWVDSLDDGLRPIIDAGYKPLNCGSPAPQTDVLAAAAPPRSTPSAARRSITAGGADASPATSASVRKRGSSSQRAATGTSERHSPAR